MAQNPEAVVIVGAYLPTARFIELADSLNFKPLFICLSFVGTTALSLELKKSSTAVAVTQVVPFPHLSKTHHQKNFNFVSLEGYLAGRLTIEVLRQLGKNPTRIQFLKTIKKIKTFFYRWIFSSIRQRRQSRVRSSFSHCCSKRKTLFSKKFKRVFFIETKTINIVSTEHKTKNSTKPTCKQKQ